MTNLREYSGFKVSDDFVLTLNSKGGTVDVNLQECMAVRLHKSTDAKVFSWYVSTGADKGNDVATELGISYNHIEIAREHAKWLDAKVQFVNNNTLTPEQGKLLDAKSKRSAKTSDNKVNFNRTHASNFGMYVFENMPSSNAVMLAGFDPNHSDFKPGLWNKVVSVISAELGLHRYEVKAKKAEIARILAEQEKQEKLSKLQASAKTALNGMGFSEDDDNWDAMLKTQMTLLESVLDLVS